MKRILSLAAVVAVAATTVFAVAAYAGSSSATATSVKVTAKDSFRFTLSRTQRTARQGQLRGHEQRPAQARLRDRRQEDEMLGHNQSATLTVTLTKGSISTSAPSPGHAAAGMKGTFKAT